MMSKNMVLFVGIFIVVSLVSFIYIKNIPIESDEPKAKVYLGERYDNTPICITVEDTVEEFEARQMLLSKMGYPTYLRCP